MLGTTPFISFWQDEVAALRSSAAAALQQLEEAGGGSAAGVVAQVRFGAACRCLFFGGMLQAAQLEKAWGGSAGGMVSQASSACMQCGSVHTMAAT